ncbi:queuosine precursor transporter [Tabrizicola sp.]|uniref:queuosine precursor transporter n=1 Tax=Tabrizicola sp. TaxID=2005166 RepID=UPI00260BAB99|nr:queuosine precursor transporter [Tabrizicola sp.]MDM7932309.1 queuosine precursor transporter [Tabrizicola sp.]
MRSILPGVIAMAVVVTASNILVQYPLGAFLTWGALTYPFAFLVTDLTNRLQGPDAARRVVLVGFGVGVLCSFIGTQIVGEFGPLVTLRIAVGSGFAFLCAQLLDIAVFNRLRAGTWWRAPLVSTLASSSLDTALFFSIAFSATLTLLEPGNDVSWATGATPLLGFGTEAPFWVSLALADWGVKLLLALLALLPFRLAVARAMARVA